MGNLDTGTDLYIRQRNTYLESECKRLASENDLLRATLHHHADEANVLMGFYFAFKTWQDSGCQIGDVTHAALSAAFAETAKL